MSRTNAQDAAAVSATPCDATVLGAAFSSGGLALHSVSQYACESGWAYVWANIGGGPSEVSVTEVLRFNALSGVWKFAQRQDVCKPTILPREIYLMGCFSN
ncbi:MAG: hypothetical protein ACYC19_01560 [Acidimicrobiales bacterium]